MYGLFNYRHLCSFGGNYYRELWTTPYIECLCVWEGYQHTQPENTCSCSFVYRQTCVIQDTLKIRHTSESTCRAMKNQMSHLAQPFPCGTKAANWIDGRAANSPHGSLWWRELPKGVNCLKFFWMDWMDGLPHSHSPLLLLSFSLRFKSHSASTSMKLFIKPSRTKNLDMIRPWRFPKHELMGYFIGAWWFYTILFSIFGIRPWCFRWIPSPNKIDKYLPKPKECISKKPYSQAHPSHNFQQKTHLRLNMIGNRSKREKSSPSSILTPFQAPARRRSRVMGGIL